MSKVIAVTNQKGGVGKTATTLNLGVGLARKGKKVLLIDADPQGSLTVSLGFSEQDEMDVTLATILEKVINDEKLSEKEGIITHEEGLELLPGNIELSALEVSLVNAMSRERIFRQYLETIKDLYDYILIDCPPTLGMLTINALTCADSVIIPVAVDYLPVKGLQQLLVTIGKVKRQLNAKLDINGILLTMYDSRTNFAKDIAELLQTSYGKEVRIFKEYIPVSVKVKEATAEGCSIYKYAPSGKVAHAYNSMAEEVLADEK